MAELKTKPTKQNAREFLRAIEPEEKRRDALALLALFQKATGEKPVMWGSSMVGFGTYHYKSERSSQEGDWPLVAFSPRKQNLTLYILAGFTDTEGLLKTLGKHTRSVGCLYIKRLADVDASVLEELVRQSFTQMKARHASA